MVEPHSTETSQDVEAQRRATLVRPVTNERVRAVLVEAGAPWFVDGDGDLGILWRRGTVRLDLWRSTRRAAILLLSAAWHRRPTIERLGALMVLAEEWNAGSEGLKTYLRVLDDGDVLVCFESALLIQSGASDRQLLEFLHSSMSAVFDRVAELEARYPDPISFPEVDE